MKFVLIISLFLFGHSAVLPQVADKALQIERIQTIVGSLVSNSGKAEFLLSDLNVVKGSVVALTEDGFSLKIKNLNGEKRIVKVLYKDVLVISGKNVAVSLIPDPDLRAFGKWDDLLGIDYNHKLEVVLDNGQIVSGRLNEKTNDRLTLIGETIDKKNVFPRNLVVSVYRIWKEYDEVREGAASGARKGRNIGAEIGITPDGKGFSAAFGAAIGAIIGTIVGASKTEAKLRVLIYSK